LFSLALANYLKGRIIVSKEIKMGLFRSESGESIARIGLYEAGNLSKVAGSFGARTAREARKHPGGFNRPVVGDPSYYARRAGKVFQEAVKADKALDRMYSHAWTLSTRLKQAATKPYPIGGLSVEAAIDLVEISENIQARIAEKDLHIDLSGKWLGRALDISSFALRVIVSPEVALEARFAESRGEARGTLYAGLSPDVDVNRADYWHALQQSLITSHQASVQSKI